MMINCPNCNLLQPKDQYCAQCGVNMETWKPPEAPFWRKILSNWMVQLTLLFVVILAVVMWDTISSRNKDSGGSLPPVSSEIRRQEVQETPSTQGDSFREEEPRQEKRQVFTGEPKVKEQTVQESSRDTISVLQKRVSMKIAAFSRNSLDQLTQLGQRVDEGVYVIPRKQGTTFVNKNRRRIKGLGSTIRNNFEFGQPIELFLGEQDADTGAGIGFYAQVTVEGSSSVDNITAEIRFWHHLKLGDVPSPPLTYLVNTKRQDGIYIVDPSVHDLEFTPEEMALFDASDKLEGLNDEAFVERLSDIVLIIEIK